MQRLTEPARLYNKAFFVEGNRHHVHSHWFGAECTTFKDFAHVQCKRRAIAKMKG